MIFLFDVDGTLTLSRKRIDPKFKDFFYNWVVTHQEYGDEVYFVTGSDKDKTIEQVGEKIWLQVDGSYQNCANQLYSKGQLIREFSWRLPDDLMWDIIGTLSRSQWYGTAKGNIEIRIGMINISTVGRECSSKDRAKYYKWDKENKERELMVKTLKSRYPKIEFSIGGEISIDVYPEGRDKSQVMDDLKGESVFFGDSCDAGGNDHSISRKCSTFHQVKNWEETKRILEMTL
tara:strand:- start:2042 stop:2737 length:696 start_codon:yes stop_codon:yes gene_type:complete